MKQKQVRRPPKPVERLFQSFREFARLEASGGIVLLAAVIAALIWANSPGSDLYTELWETEFTIGFGPAALSKPLHLWINDGLMAIFFFVVGLEIKREAMAGELNTPRQAALPVIAAIGGMILPALIYLAINGGSEASQGWGIPMATDIAISLGVLALLGSRIPVALKIFLTALAIVDDIGAVLVIALFYTSEAAWGALGAAAGILLILIILNRFGFRQPLIYAVLGVGLWFAFLQSGVHATIAGVLLALVIPAQTRIDPDVFVERGRGILHDLERAPGIKTDLLSGEQLWAVHRLENESWKAQTTLQRFEHTLLPWNTYLIVPLFALANAGVRVSGNLAESLTSPVSIGIILGLVIGKQIGITAFTWIAVRAGWAKLPDQITWRHIYGVSWLAGIGFTMSLFIDSLAFEGTPYLEIAKMGIITASTAAGIGGWLILRTIPAPNNQD